MFNCLTDKNVHLIFNIFLCPVGVRIIIDHPQQGKVAFYRHVEFNSFKMFNKKPNMDLFMIKTYLKKNLKHHKHKTSVVLSAPLWNYRSPAPHKAIQTLSYAHAPITQRTFKPIVPLNLLLIFFSLQLCCTK